MTEFEVFDGEDGHYWRGHAEGDKDSVELDSGESLILDPSHFEVGYRVVGLEPAECSKCGQVDGGQTGEYPCPICGLPRLWDGKPPAGGFI